ncbi:ParB/RepB/Spo0J family partition protein [Acidisphaera sp. L21]|uniref:ParB/RepB/Spo0J family partition protein n=1 Tax=Acidisphaera sp. L21 TaxID=1641851 RepID=UPI00131B89F8|nr:ParB/RepB/Spo0J family partition protein [Acidisphaera sp. L21]
MRKPFDLTAITASLPTLPEDGVARPAAARSSMVPIAKAIETQHRNAMAELKALERAIEERRADGLVVEEIDPDLTDASPYWDRDQRFLEDRSFAEFVEDVRRQGQQSPALLRRHPSESGRFEICFGHRRALACKQIGRPLRAVVRDLNEAQMAGAAFSENTQREGVSILEQARALSRYIERGVFPTKQALADALHVSRPHVSNLTSFAEIPDLVLEALGDWRKCTFRDANALFKQLQDPDRKAAMLAAASELVSEGGSAVFPTRMAQLLGRPRDDAEAPMQICDPAGNVLVSRRAGGRSEMFTFAAGRGDGLADFVWKRMAGLAEEYRKHSAGKK